MPRLSKIGAAALGAFGWTGLSSVSATYLQVAGGGGGAGYVGGGGGAGGYLTGTTSLNPTLSYTVIVGGGGVGGAGAATGATGINGSNSQFGTLTASVGGGAGGSNGGNIAGSLGGSGGGSGGGGSTPGGAATSGQGNAGGTGGLPSNYGGAGGGGAGAVGGNGSTTNGGNGGAGSASSITGTSVTYAGGGGGGTYQGGTAGTGGSGGGGAAGAASGNNPGIAGTANLGGGGGAASFQSSYVAGGNGGSGVVIISYAGAQQFGGGVVTSSGGNTIHTFNTSGTLAPLSSLTASYLIVAGGGSSGYDLAGGGGAGGLLSGSGLTIDTNSSYLVTVGAGAAGVTSGSGNSGSSSAFSMVSTSASGGGGGGRYAINGVAGASGGGAGGDNANAGPFTGGSATPAGQGNAGGGSNKGATTGGGGGGGSGGTGGTGTTSTGGAGGIGSTSSISGTSTYYAGGGGGGGYSPSSIAAGAGGSGGGGAGGATTNQVGTAGTANTGGGGGGTAGGGGAGTSAAGGSGIVIISYAGATQQMAGGTVTISGGNVIHTFTSSGYLTPLKLVNNSLRFRKSASGYLSRTMNATSTTYTVSAWVKRGLLSGYQYIFASGPNSASNDKGIAFDTSTNQIYAFNGTTQALSTAVFRDPAAWYHVVMSVSSGTATVYVNSINTGISQTSMSLGTYGRIGRFNDSSSANDFDGYMTEFNLIDGLALTPNSFGTFNSYGVWQPITYGGSYGTNGFYLPFNGGTQYYVNSFSGASSTYWSVTNSAIAVGTGDFTFECWFWAAATGANMTGAGASGVNFFTIATSANGVVDFYMSTGAGSAISSQAGAWKTNQWNYLNINRSSGTVTVNVNGIAGTGTSNTTNLTNASYPLVVGGYTFTDAGRWTGLVSNLRFSSVVRSITVPTAPLTSDANTKLLTSQNSTFIDNSTNGYTITTSGSVTNGLSYPLSNVQNDQSPAGNNWTLNNISQVPGSNMDVMTDVPTLTSATAANYCVLNPLQLPQTAATSTSNGNLQLNGNTGSAYNSFANGTIFITSGKWYAEFQQISGTRVFAGISSFTDISTPNNWNASSTYYINTGQIEKDGVAQTSGASWTTGDIIGVAYDAGAATCAFYKNNSLQLTVTGIPARTYSFSVNGYTSGVIAANFGQQPFTYTPPTGYIALNTYNI